jgi:hypothetical protein
MNFGRTLAFVSYGSLDNPPVRVYLWRLLWRWTVFNALVFGALYYACLALCWEAPIV